MRDALSIAVAGEEPKRDAPATRDVSIDVARGIAIILVVIGHNRAVSSAWPALVSAIFLFHVPLFFLLSGRVLRPEHPMRAAPRLAVRLLLPFALAALLVGAAKCLTRGEPAAETLLGILWATGQTLPWSHLWFLPTLFLALLATHTVATMTKSAGRWAALIALAAMVSAALPMASSFELAGFPAPVGWPWSLDLLAPCLLFVWLGQLLRGSPAARSAASHPLALAGAAAVFAALVSVAAVDLNLRVFTPFAAALAVALAGCLLTLRMSRLLAHLALVARPLALVGRHTLVIFILHVSLQKVLLGAFVGEMPPGTALGLWGLASAAATIVLTLLVAMLIEHLWTRRSGTHDAAPSEAR
jgi:polysaccharide biosynthesis protein PslL